MPTPRATFFAGQSAGNEAVSGVDNTANGNGALGLNTSGAENTVQGEQALPNNTTGNYNTASGAAALFANTNGSENTAMGWAALYANTSGTNNLAIGYGGGDNLTTGNNNIEIGNQGVSSDSGIIRIGTPGTQTQTFIAGVLNGNGSGLTNLNLNAAQLPATVVTNHEPNVTLGNDFTLGGSLNLPTPASINSGGQSLLWADANANTYLGSDAGNGGIGFFNTGVGEFALGNSMQDGGLVAIGYEALANENAGNNSFTIGGGGENTAVGYEALASDTNGAGNTALGFQALLYNESGLANTAVGDSALADCNIGSNNVAMGYSALFDNTSGSENTANGVYALQNNTSGTDNTANGAYALQNNTSGHDNVADGFQALGNCSDNTSYEVAIGYNALLNDHSVFTSFTLSGYGQNTAVGTGALSSDTSGAANTALGYYSLGNNVIGNGNTAIGVQALDGLASGTGGSKNTAIGYQVLDSLLAGNGNIAIGSGAGNQCNFGSDNIYIGNQGAGIESGNIYIGTEGVHTNTYLVGTVTVNGSVVLTSDRNAKENFKPVDNQAVLARVASLPITEWNYKTDSKDVQHIGPMAQDFQAAFGLDGADDKHISVVDEGGVALAAIQGLNQKLNESDAEIEKLKVKADKVDSLEKQLHELKQLVQSLAQQK